MKPPLSRYRNLPEGVPVFHPKEIDQRTGAKLITHHRAGRKGLAVVKSYRIVRVAVCVSWKERWKIIQMIPPHKTHFGPLLAKLLGAIALELDGSSCPRDMMSPLRVEDR